MKGRRFTGLIIVVVLAVLVRVFSYFPHAVETYFSNGFYPYIASMQRILFGWIPFSIGDFFYAAVVIWMIYRFARFIKGIFNKKLVRNDWIHALASVFSFSLWVYVLFNLLWGMNYNRLPMADRVGITPGPYSVAELNHVMSQLVKQLNELDSIALPFREALEKKPRLFAESVRAYKHTGTQYDFLCYNYPSVKPSIYSMAGNYLGFSGYYNPFSGEAQVNTTIPTFIRPFVTCHEIGHQLGFAKENEANFAGFLSARDAPNPAFRYSVYFDMYAYALNELFLRDSMRAKAMHQQLDEQVQKDYASMRNFFAQYRNPLEPVIRSMYGEYLKANEQPGGMKSYNQVVAMLVAYQRKYKTL
jgi:hypothetical protein